MRYHTDNRYSDIRSILHSLHLNIEVGYDVFEIKRAVANLNSEIMLDAVSKSEKLRTYKMFKNDNILEGYVRLNLSKIQIRVTLEKS